MAAPNAGAPGNQPGQGGQGRPPDNNAAAAGGLPNPIGRYGGLWPRWPLLAAIFLLPIGLIGYGLDRYYQAHLCTFGFVCTADVWPAPVQVIVIWLGFGLLWLLMLLLGTWQGVEGDDSIHSWWRSWMRAISAFQTIRPYMGALGSLAVAGLLLVWLNHQLNALLVASITIFIFVAFDIAFHPVQPRRRPRTAQERLIRGRRRANSFLGILRSIPPFRWIFPMQA